MLRFAAQDRDGAMADLDALDKTQAPQAQMRLAMAHLYSGLEAAQGDADLAATRKLEPNIDLKVAHAGLMPEAATKP